MPPKPPQPETPGTKTKPASSSRERELRDLIDRVEAEKSGNVRPSRESPHDFVERRMREKTKP